MKRVFVYAKRLFAVIILLVSLVLAWPYLREPMLVLWWHLNHGSKVVFQGHTITLPLMWRVDRSDTRPGLNLSRAVIGQYYFGDELEIESPTYDGAGIVDEESALRWQTEKLGELNSKPKLLSRVSVDNLRARSLSFYCVDFVSARNLPHGDGFLCKAGGTNWFVMSDGPQKELEEAKGILKSIE